MSKTITVGGSLYDAAQRFKDTLHRAERGEDFEPIDTVTFLTWSALASVMTDKRFELLRHLRQYPAASIRALARAVGRDYKRVHDDLSALSGIGLVVRDGETWRVDFDEIHTSISLRPTTPEPSLHPS
jgi:predicted transcriptional regulator